MAELPKLPKVVSKMLRLVLAHDVFELLIQRCCDGCARVLTREPTLQPSMAVVCWGHWGAQDHYGYSRWTAQKSETLVEGAKSCEKKVSGFGGHLPAEGLLIDLVQALQAVLHLPRHSGYLLYVFLQEDAHT